MKILKDNIKDSLAKATSWHKQQVCPHCFSMLEIETSDFKYDPEQSQGMCFSFNCGVCSVELTVHEGNIPDYVAFVVKRNLIKQNS